MPGGHQAKVELRPVIPTPIDRGARIREHRYVPDGGRGCGFGGHRAVVSQGASGGLWHALTPGGTRTLTRGVIAMAQTKRRGSLVTARLVEQVTIRYGVTSGKELADLLEVSPMTVSRYQTQGNGPADEVAIKAAQLLSIDPGEVLAELQVERAKTREARQAWTSVLERTRKAA